jgi:hypothetical protein
MVPLPMPLSLRDFRQPCQGSVGEAATAPSDGTASAEADATGAARTATEAAAAARGGSFGAAGAAGGLERGAAADDGTAAGAAADGGQGVGASAEAAAAAEMEAGLPEWARAAVLERRGAQRRSKPWKVVLTKDQVAPPPGRCYRRESTGANTQLAQQLRIRWSVPLLFFHIQNISNPFIFASTARAEAARLTVAVI